MRGRFHGGGIIVPVLVAAVAAMVGGSRLQARSVEPSEPVLGTELGRDASSSFAPVRFGVGRGEDDRSSVWEDDYRCVVPVVPVEVSDGCSEGESYPDCRWRIPAPRKADHLYRIWRNTRPEHREGRPGLVALILAAAASYSRLYPGEALVVGDLDAPGPRHRTHRNGQDVDLYLPGAMIAENVSLGEYPSNYLYAGPLERAMLRARVETLAKILAVCSGGSVRIYYNDPIANRSFQKWFLDRGMRSPFGPPIRNHNDLHRFHFHVTVPETLEALPFAEEPTDLPAIDYDR